MCTTPMLGRVLPMLAFMLIVPLLIAVPDVAEAQKESPELVAVTGSTAGWLLADGTRQWVPATCRIQLETVGATFADNRWSTFGSLPRTKNKRTCNQIQAMFDPGPQLVTTATAPAGWLILNGTRQWLSPACRLQLETLGLSFSIAKWQTFDEQPKSANPLTCDAVQTYLGPTTPPPPTPTPTPQPPTPASTATPQPPTQSVPTSIQCQHPAARHIPVSECEALVDIWIEAGKDRSPFNDPCFWSGVTCANGVVTGLRIFGYRTGQLSNSIGDLPNLEAFDPWGFSGPMPSGIGNLTKLTSLSLVNSTFSSLPDEIGNLSALTSLNLRSTGLTTLPEGIGGLRALEVLNVRDNNLQTLPDSIGNMQNLQLLDLRNNQLSGLPAGFGRLDQQGLVFDLTGNRLRTVPPEFGNLTNQTEISLARNEIVQLPDEIGQLTGLTRLDISHNRLTALPNTIGQLDSLIFLNVDYNDLVSLPPTIGDIASLEILTLRENALTSIPPQLGTLNTLRWLELADNQLTGSIPPELGGMTSLRALSLGGNTLTGEFPAELALPSLADVDLAGSCVDDTDPALSDWLVTSQLWFRPGWTCIPETTHVYGSPLNLDFSVGTRRVSDPTCLALLEIVVNDGVFGPRPLSSTGEASCAEAFAGLGYEELPSGPLYWLATLRVGYLLAGDETGPSTRQPVPSDCVATLLDLDYQPRYWRSSTITPLPAPERFLSCDEISALLQAQDQRYGVARGE